MNKQISIWMILLILLFSFSSCTTVSKVSEKVGKALYNPVTEKRQVGETVTTKKEITGYKVAEVANAEGVVEEIKQPIYEIITLKEPVYEDVIVGYEPNALGELLEAGAALVPIPGVSTATGGLLSVGGIGLLALERLRRKEKKGKVSMEEKFQITVGGIKDFLKTEEGDKLRDELLGAVTKKADDFGVRKEFNTAVKVAKAIL